MSDLDEKELINIVEDEELEAPELSEEEQVELDEETVFIATVEVRLRSIVNVIKNLTDDVDVDFMLGTNGLPYIKFDLDGNEINISYYPIGEIGEDRFILFIRSTVYVPEEPDNGIALLCESFNMGSPYGFAVYDPIDGSVELRAQISEYGGVSSEEQYGQILDLFVYSMVELTDSILEG